MVKTELYFGLDIPGEHRQVSNADFTAFVQHIVSHRFPAGLTVISGMGMFRMSDGSIVSEPSRIIILVHDGTPDDVRAISDIRSIYKAMYSQESVMMLTSTVEVDF